MKLYLTGFSNAVEPYLTGLTNKTFVPKGIRADDIGVAHQLDQVCHPHENKDNEVLATGQWFLRF